MPTKKREFEKPCDCPVCYESLKTCFTSLHCGHWVCEKCFKSQVNTLCPLCRAECDTTKAFLASFISVDVPLEMVNTVIQMSDEDNMPWFTHGAETWDDSIESKDSDNEFGEIDYPDEDDFIYDDRDVIHERGAF